MSVFATAEARNDYARKCLDFGVDPGMVCAEMEFASVTKMYVEVYGRPVWFDARNRLNHMTATLKAHHAKMLKERGLSRKQVAQRCGYVDPNSVDRAIRNLKNAPSPVAR